MKAFEATQMWASGQCGLHETVGGDGSQGGQVHKHVCHDLEGIMGMKGSSVNQGMGATTEWTNSMQARAVMSVPGSAP